MKTKKENFNNNNNNNNNNKFIEDLIRILSEKYGILSKGSILNKDIKNDIEYLLKSYFYNSKVCNDDKVCDKLYCYRIEVQFSTHTETRYIVSDSNNLFEVIKKEDNIDNVIGIERLFKIHNSILIK